jgi:catechol 2,3-dioxygenase-like lactoylglutathione lyase family enzyme
MTCWQIGNCLNLFKYLTGHPDIVRIMRANLQWNHAGLRVRNLEKSLYFYTTIFGFIIKERRPAKLLGDTSLDVVFLDANGGTIELIGSRASDGQASNFTSATPTGVVHLAFNTPNLMEFEVHCLRHDITVTRLIDSAEVLRGIHLADPDGIILEVSECIS